MDGNPMQFDLLIINGTVYDGTGAVGLRADVGIDGKRVSDVGDLSAATATRVIDATGLVVTPGFIDVHSHADAALLRDGQHACGIRQGVTTEIIAPDGLTLAPALARQLPDVHALLERYLGLCAGRPRYVLVCDGDVELPQQDIVQRRPCSLATDPCAWRPSEG